jgi:hypothetical protein
MKRKEKKGKTRKVCWFLVEFETLVTGLGTWTPEHLQSWKLFLRWPTLCFACSNASLRRAHAGTV